MSAKALQLLFRPVTQLGTKLTPFSWWSEYVSFISADREGLTTLDQALLGGYTANKLAFAFVAGYQTAQSALGLRRGIPDDAISSFCVTEKGNRPKDIRSTLKYAANDSDMVLNGDKSFVSMAPGCALLNVIAQFVPSNGAINPTGRPQLMCVAIPVNSPGVSIVPKPALSFLCEVPHAAATFTNVHVPVKAMYSGDGYDAFMKPFRTTEDMHVQAACLGHVFRLLQSVKSDLGRRDGDKPTASAYTINNTMERLLSHAAGLASLSHTELTAHPRPPAVHLAVSGALNSGFDLLSSAFEVYMRVAAEVGRRVQEEASGWQRDYEKLGTVAAGARQARRDSAWNRVYGYEAYDM